MHSTEYPSIPFVKYHALGNDYLVLQPKDLTTELTPAVIRRICHRNYGIGSDGILFGPIASSTSLCALRIFNPDGSEAEKSGNGLRIFSRFLFEQKLAGAEPFAISTLGGEVVCTVSEKGKMVTVEMGQVSFTSQIIPVAGPMREVINEEITVDGSQFIFCAATIGNPHCVIPMPEISAAMAKRYGPQIETLPIFPNRINVQFMQIIDRENIRIEIWERGAGYTLASGSSSTAAAAVAHRLNFCDQNIAVHMPGGTIQICFGEDFSATMTGPVTKVGEGILVAEMFTDLDRA